MSRLSIEIADHQHQQIKAMAALRGVSIKDFILEATASKATEALEKPLFQVDETWTSDEKAALSGLEALLMERMAEVKRGAFSSRTMDELLALGLKD